MYKETVIQNKLEVEELKEKLLDISEEIYYLFITGFNTGIELQDLLELTKKDLIKIKESKKVEIIEAGFWEEVGLYMEKFGKDEYVFQKQNTKKTYNKEEICKILYDTAQEIGIDGVGDETLRKTYGYFHYQKYRNIERLRKRFELISPTATLHYIGYKDDSQLCFHCNIGCLWKIK